MVPNIAVSLTIQLDISHLFTHSSISNNSVEHRSLVYTQLNDQTVLFLTIKLSISHLFVLYSNVKQFYLTYQVLPLWSRVDLWEIAMKRYFPFPKAPGLDPHHQLFNVISRTFIGEVLPFGRDAVGVFYCPSWLGSICYNSNLKFLIVI